MKTVRFTGDCRVHIDMEHPESFQDFSDGDIATLPEAIADGLIEAGAAQEVSGD